MKTHPFNQLLIRHSSLLSKLVAACFLCLVVTIAYLHFTQQKTVRMSMQRLIALENARTDLAKGFLFSIADKSEDSPFHRGQDMVLLLQAQQTLVNNEREPTPSAAHVKIRLNNSLDAFIVAIREWQATPNPNINAAIKLRVHFQEVDI